MYNLIFFKKLSHFELEFFVMMIYGVFCGHSTIIDLEDNSICGLTKKQIQDLLSYSNKYPIKGIALSPKCLEVQNVNYDQCLMEQNKLIECLQKEYFLAKARENREIEPMVKDEKQKCLEVDGSSVNNNRDWKNIADGNEELDTVAKDYDETVSSHLQSIANLTRNSARVDDLKAALIETKFELSAALRRRILDDNADEAKRLGVHCVGNCRENGEFYAN